MISKIKATHIFILLAIGIMGMSLFLYYTFNHTEKKIVSVYNSENIKYVQSFTNNLKHSIVKTLGNTLYTSLKTNPKFIYDLEENLQLFVTDKYKYIYLLDKENIASKHYRFLLDGSKNLEDKSEFEESYLPLEIDKFNHVYETKKVLIFKHKYLESVWITYLSPIVINDEVQAIIVVDFSMKHYKIILNALKNFDKTFKYSLWFFILLFFTILWFTFTDLKREKEKEEAFEQLKVTGESLRLESIKVKNFNKTLEKTVKEEVSKNCQKDQQLLHQSRLAQMGEMLSMIAHQWRQPLAAISATSATLEFQATLGKMNTESVIKSANKISNYSQHLSVTIDDFRDFFKPTKKQKEISAIDIIHSVLGIVKVSIENKDIRIIEEIHTEETVKTYPNEVKQVILNLIKNAEDILLEKEIQEAYIKIKTYVDKDTYIFEISDNGGGIPKDIIAKIFDPYFSTKLEKNGTGLGLYMSKIIIKEHCNGEITVHNNQHGAVFKIIFS